MLFKPLGEFNPKVCLSAHRQTALERKSPTVVVLPLQIVRGLRVCLGVRRIRVRGSAPFGAGAPAILCQTQEIEKWKRRGLVRRNHTGI